MDKAKKKTIKRAITWILLAVLVAVLSVMPLLARQEQQADGPVASILEATAQVSSVSNVLKGGGTLEAGKAMKVNLPNGVKIKEFLVKNGDIVTEGTPVATVDRVSVMNAILGVEDTMEYLHEQIASANDDTVSGTIKATAGGRVKQVYAKKGDSVQDVMLAYGSLAVLSLDGRMAVELEANTQLAAGDSVRVAIAGETVDGRVESNVNEKLIITVEDEKYPIGEAAAVTTREGEEIGTGKLYVHNAWYATAFSGTVKNVNAKEETEVNSGTILLSLEDTDFEGTMQSLANLHREYEELLQRLFVMYETEVLTAPCDGMVSGIDKDSPHLLAALEGEQGWFVDLLNNETTNRAEKGWTVVKLTSQNNNTLNSSPNNSTANECTGDENCPVIGNHDENKNCPKNICDLTPTCAANLHQDACKRNCDNASGCDAKVQEAHLDTCPEKCLNSLKCKASVGRHLNSCPQKCKNSAGCTVNNHLDTCPERCTVDGNCTATVFANHHEDCPQRCQNKTGCTAKDENHLDTCPEVEYTEYIGMVGVVNTATGGSLSLSVVNKQSTVICASNGKWDFGTLDVARASGAVLDKKHTRPMVPSSPMILWWLPIRWKVRANILW